MFDSVNVWDAIGLRYDAMESGRGKEWNNVAAKNIITVRLIPQAGKSGAFNRSCQKKIKRLQSCIYCKKTIPTAERQQIK